MLYRRLERYLQSFKFRNRFVVSRERQVLTALLPAEVRMAPIALYKLRGVRYSLHVAEKSKISLPRGKEPLFNDRPASNLFAVVKRITYTNNILSHSILGWRNICFSQWKCERFGHHRIWNEIQLEFLTILQFCQDPVYKCVLLS
jgi:hypothetical protein